MDRKNAKSEERIGTASRQTKAPLGTDHDSLSARRLFLVEILVFRRAFRRVVAVSTARAATVEFHSVARARDAVSFAGTAAAS